jgi:putative zinc finger/helix-turn-helix YgiT family protein
MNCEECGGTLVSRREDYDYTKAVGGLPVLLLGVEVRRCQACGWHEVAIRSLTKLHRVLAKAVIAKRARLTPAEIRFLRKHIGWSGVDFARHMGVAPETVSRWENGKEAMGSVADRLLRLMVVTCEPVRDYSIDDLAEIGDESRSTPISARIENGGEWLALPQAA